MRRKFWLISLLPLILVGLGFAVWQHDASRVRGGLESREQVVTAFVNALRSNDGEALRDLNHPDYDARDVPELLHRLADPDLQLQSSKLLDTFGPHSFVQLTLRKGNETLEQELTLEDRGSRWHGARWFGLVGQHKNPVENPGFPAIDNQRP